MTKNTILIAAIVVVIVAAAVVYMLPRKVDSPVQNDTYADIVDYHTCHEAGFPIQESFPPKCTTPDGRTFIEDLKVESDVVVETPTIGMVVKSPLVVKGKAKNSWFFEANIPVTLKDGNGKILAQKGFSALGDWTIPGYVEFADTLVFETPTTEFGVLLIEKDNPSGLPENDASFAVPVKFK